MEYMNIVNIQEANAAVKQILVIDDSNTSSSFCEFVGFVFNT